LAEIKEAAGKNAQAILDSAGLLSFSKAAENPLLWGHYAASFKGACAVFRRGASPKSALAACADVAYVTERPILQLSSVQELSRRRVDGENYDDLAQKIFYVSFFHKSEHWAYEQEARIFHPFHALKNLSFDPSELVGFILGPNSSEELKIKLRTEIKSRSLRISLDTASLSQNEFRIIIPHRFRQHNVGTSINPSNAGLALTG
jgi:hypothetical protein